MKQMFYGGVHPAEHKEATEQKPIQPLANAPAQVVIPMSMHIGAPCKPVVQKGDTVTVGQKIGETAGLGAKTKEPAFTEQFKGLSAPLTLKGNVDSVSGASVSSGAIVNGVNAVLDYVADLEK